MPSIGIGETLRKERGRQGISLDDIARYTKIQRRFLDAIEAEDFNGLPGLIFTRNFVRQYAEALHLDAEAIVAGLPKLDESMIQLPVPPLQPRRRTRYTAPGSGYASLVWLTLAIVAAVGLYLHFEGNRFFPMARIRADIAVLRKIGIAASRTTDVEAASTPAANTAIEPKYANAATPPQASGDSDASSVASVSSVQVVVTAVQKAWVELSADGKTSFAGVMMPNETKEISAAEQVKIVAGNAGGVTVSLNGKPLEPLGQVRVVRLTAEGPQFLEAVHLPSPDPL